MSEKQYSGWLNKFMKKLQKEAIDKLPQDELNGVMPNMTGGADPSQMGADPSMMGADPSMMGMAPPAPVPPVPAEEKPLVWDNKYLVQTDSAKFIVELTPKIVNDPATPGMPAAQADPMSDTTLNPGADPNALGQWMQGQGQEKPFQPSEKGTVDPLSREEEGLAPIEDVGNEQMLPSVKVHNKRKASSQAGYPESEDIRLKHVVDGNRQYHPDCFHMFSGGLAQAQDFPYHDNDTSVIGKSCGYCNQPFNQKPSDTTSVHPKVPALTAALEKKAEDMPAGQNMPPQKTPGADRSNAYPPCKYCANYNAADNTCSQGLDVEKVQAAGSCSWLNSNFKPFLDPKGGNETDDPTRKDQETFKNDISDLQGGNGGGAMEGGPTRGIAANKNDVGLQDYLKRMWE